MKVISSTASSVPLADAEPLWSSKRVSEYINCAEVTVRSWRRTGLGPRYLKLTNRQVRYRPSDVRAWLEDRALTNTSEVSKSVSSYRSS